MGEPLKFSGLNSIGLRRKNFPLKARNQIKQAYRLIYQSDLNRSQAISQIQKEFNNVAEIHCIVDFIGKSDRGLI